MGVEAIVVTPRRAAIGGRIRIAFALVSQARSTQEVMVDLRIHYAKAGGRSAPKVFKLARLSLARGGSASLAKDLSLAQLTTRTHHPGTHRVEALINGRVFALGSFRVTAAR